MTQCFICDGGGDVEPLCEYHRVYANTWLRRELDAFANRQRLRAIPRIGDEFVEMEASAGEWGEQTAQIADVLGRVDGNAGCWRIEWGQSSVAHVPDVFRQRYGEGFGKPRLHQTVVEFRDGRWRRAAVSPSSPTNCCNSSCEP